MKTQRILTGLLAIAILALPALAVDYVSAGSGNWSESANWSPPGVPNGAGDNVVINHAINLNGNYTVNSIAIGPAGMFTSGAYTLMVHGDWTNNGVVSLSNGYVVLTGTANTGIGGDSATAFFRLRVDKDTLTTTVTMNQDVSCVANISGALHIEIGTLNTNNQDLTVDGGASSRVTEGQSPGERILNITGTTSTVTINHLYQWGNAVNLAGRGYVTVSGTPTVNIGSHTIANSHRTFTMTGGTLNYTGAGVNLYLTGHNGGLGTGYHVTGGSVSFNGSVFHGINSYFSVVDPAEVRYVGGSDATVTLHSSVVASPHQVDYNFLGIEKAGGATVSFTTSDNSGGVANRSVTAHNGVEVGAGAGLTLGMTGYGFADGHGYDFVDIVNNGTVTVNRGPLMISGDVSGIGTWTYSLTPSAVRFKGSGQNSFASGSPSRLYDLVVAKSPDGSLALANDLAVDNELLVSGGGFALGEHELTLGTASAPGSITVADSASFAAVGAGTDARAAVSAADPAQPYAFVVRAGGAIAARHAAFTGMDADGITIEAGAAIDPDDNFTHCSFTPGEAVGAMLTIAGDQVLDDIVHADFFGEQGYNIDYTGGTGRVTVTDGTGERWGEDYDNDPDELVTWAVSTRRDVGPTAIHRPAGSVVLGSELYPQVTVENFGELPESFMVAVTIDDGVEGVVFQEEEEVVELGVGENRVITFATYFWVADPVGEYTVTAVTRLAGDADPTNDTAGPNSFTVTERPPWDPGWVEVTPMPLQPSGRTARRGAWLALNEGDGLIYATKGYKTQDFFRYDPLGDSWTELASPPVDPTRGRPLEKGARGAADGDNTIYMVHGNNTLAFWQYDIAANEWTGLADVPEGPSRKRVKGGGDLVYVTADDHGYVYLLKGDRLEFYRYDIAGGQWQQLADAPVGIRNRFKRDGWLAWDGTHTIYTHKPNYFDRASETHELWRYDIPGDSWYSQQLAGMPLFGLHQGRIKRKKAKDGGAGAYDAGRVLALKGGNTQQFWLYDVAADSWDELDTVPTLGSTGRRRRVNAGADLVGYGNGAFFALKGNKTLEMWRYVLPMGFAARPQAGRGGAMAGELPPGAPFLRVGPNPLVGGRATLRYSLPKAGPVRVSVFDVAGRELLRQSAPGNRQSTMPLDLRGLSSGIYLVQLEADGFSATRKLVLQQ
ncbi:MAG: T9SS type A sorting domain-containing protein [bacterium]